MLDFEQNKGSHRRILFSFNRIIEGLKHHRIQSSEFIKMIQEFKGIKDLLTLKDQGFVDENGPK